MLEINDAGNDSSALSENTKKKFGLNEFQSTSLMLEILAVIFSPAIKKVKSSPILTPISSAALSSIETNGEPS